LLLDQTDDPRVQVSVAGAVLRIFSTREVQALPFMHTAQTGE
jgi:hypothetical protein